MVQGLREGKAARQALGKSRGLRWVRFRDMLRNPAPADFRPEPVDPDEMAALLYSGGTTGVAKGIMLSHFNFVANAYQVRAWGALSDEQSILAVLPFFHGFGMSVTMNAPILAGGKIIILPRFSPRLVAQTIHKYKPDFFIGVPTMFVALSNLPDIGKYNLRSVKGIFVGAAPLTRAIKEDFESKTGGRMIEGYGLTEAVTAIAANPYHGLHKIGSIGIPFPDVDMKIVSLEGARDLPPGEQGEIVLRSPTVMLGYYKMPEETAKTIVDGWLFTGDIGYMDEDGYFYITDRKKRPYHRRWFQRLSAGDRRVALPAPQGEGGHHRWDSGSVQRGADQGLHCSEGGGDGHRGGVHRLLPPAPDALQSPLGGGVPHRTSQERHWKNPAAATARGGDSESTVGAGVGGPAAGGEAARRRLVPSPYEHRGQGRRFSSLFPAEGEP